ncbi:hypothetical protein AeMF1_005019 [Aphanomyces euteiches]|nr:hypothetical protein AeMF1_005019 [Aphanomyces euteiches]KAH9186090.1 hypothetical protein AeNC1_011934 [Aphanomyces euteiches]
MEKIDDSGNFVDQIVEGIPVEQQTHAITQLAIQIRRGLEYYQFQVDLGNIKSDMEFEIKVNSCQMLIESTVSEMRQEKKVSPVFGVDKFQPWLLSSDDVDFNPNDSTTILGKGGFATVFKGKYQGRAVAVKHFDGTLSPDLNDLETRIGKEINGWQAISHEPYILTLVGVCTKLRAPILVSELCQNNIRRYVRDWPEMLLPLVYQFARGLACLHNANIIHRDLKGDNVLVTFKETVAIADFGLSRSVTTLENTKTGVNRVGTLNWMSPEQYFMPRSATAKSDVWSFGMTLWEILSNDVPFRGASEFEFQNNIFQSESDRPEMPQNLDPRLEPLWTLITNCWRLKPAARLSADEIVQFLKNEFGSKLEGLP